MECEAHALAKKCKRIVEECSETPIKAGGPTRCGVRSSFLFSVFDSLHEVPKLGEICNSDPPVFGSEFDTHRIRRDAREKMGFCCSNCVTKLWRTLEPTESRKDTGKEAASNAEFDACDGRQHRLGTLVDDRNERV